MTTKIKEKICTSVYLIVVISLIVNIILSSAFFITETADTKNYYKIAQDLPQIKDSLFPLFYPFVLRITHFFTNDYFIASKILNVLIIIFLFAFLYVKNFYWKEFSILVLAFFSDIICYSWSENIFLLVLVLLLYLMRKFLSEKATKKDVALLILLHCIGILTKYSFAYILIGESLFFLFLLFRNNKIKRQYFVILLFSFAFMFCYLLINKLLTGEITGDRSDSMKAVGGYTLSIANTMYHFNPFFSRIILGYKINWMAALVPSGLFMLFWIYILYKNHFSKIVLYTLTCALTYLVFLFISFSVMRIDPIHSRLLLPFVIFFYFSVFFTNRLKFNHVTYPIVVLILIIFKFSFFLHFNPDNLILQYR